MTHPDTKPVDPHVIHRGPPISEEQENRIAVAMLKTLTQPWPKPSQGSGPAHEREWWWRSFADPEFRNGNAQTLTLEWFKGEAERSAWLYEVQRRIVGEGEPWNVLPVEVKIELIHLWPMMESKIVAPLAPVHMNPDQKAREENPWTNNPSHWTEPMAPWSRFLAFNLAASDAAILSVIHAERRRVGIPAPKAHEARTSKARSWKPVELMDEGASRSLNASERSQVSKAKGEYLSQVDKDS